MPDVVEILERPTARHIYMIAGWRQWADGGSVSSGLPQYLVQRTGARRIGSIRPDGFYLFQIPGTHDLVRPVVEFEEGHPKSLKIQTNELFYWEDNQRGVVLLLGDEPHLDIERYSAAVLETARLLGVKRIISLGGVYGELPYNKERSISCIYSLPRMKKEVSAYAVTLSDYHGGASIGSYICRRAGEQEMEFVGYYALVPTYDFSNLAQLGNAIRIENDFAAWLGIMRRINFMLKIRFDLSDLEQKSQRLLQALDDKVEELDDMSPQLSIREYLDRLAETFVEMPFDPLDDVWEEELRRIFDGSDPDSADDDEA